MSDGHLYLSARGGVAYVSERYHAWYDAVHQAVLLLSPCTLKLQTLPLDASLDSMTAATATFSPPENATVLFDFSEADTCGKHQGPVQTKSMPPIILLQLSVDGHYLAIQRSDIEVQVLHCATRVSHWILCRSNVGNRILHGGVIWSSRSGKTKGSQSLYLVTKLGLEQYCVSQKRRSCTLNRTFGLFVHDFWYAANHGVLLVSSGSRANEVVPFLLLGSVAEKLPTLMFAKSVSKSDLHLVTLYGDMYVVYSDTRSRKLLLYLVERTKVACVRSLNVMLPPGMALEYSVVDNLLVCHCIEFKVSFFFDIKCDRNSNDPFSAPLPISFRPPGQKYEIAAPSFTRWRFYDPNLVQQSYPVNESKQVEIRKLQLNLVEICKTCEHHPDIIPFLLRRGDDETAKLLVLKLVRGYVLEHQTSLSTIVRQLSTTKTIDSNERRNKILLLDGERNKAVSGSESMLRNDIDLGRTNTKLRACNATSLLRIQQTEFYDHIWRDMLQDANVVKECDLSVCLIEYIKNLREKEVPVDIITYVALAECFIVLDEPTKLYQFLHYHVLADSVELADVMVRKGEIYPALLQVGLDMYFRLKEIHLLVRTLLDIGQTERAIEIAWKNIGLSSCDSSIIPGVTFFDSLVRSVTSSKQLRSSLQVTQMLGSLLLFLKVWDPATLQCFNTTSLSTLATSATFPFPDNLILPSTREKLRMAFGFAA